ncbi:hypothetical protein FRB99_004823 [Tulasnella sp. 403]|nr:hypothetical protein FRB99_004823 [Tulasnella sp. 403]
MPKNKQYKHRRFTYNQPNLHRTFVIPSDRKGVEDVEIPAGLIRVPRGDKKDLEWRGKIGTFIADMLNLDMSAAWHIKDFPTNYSLWKQIRPGGNHIDYYLYGYGGKQRFASPNEFAVHALWMYRDDFYNKQPCQCTLCTGRPQGVINEIIYGIKRQQRRSPTRRNSGERQPGEGSYLQSIPDGPRFFTWQPTLRSVYENNPYAYVESRQRSDDLAKQDARRNRKGELVWVAIPPIISPHNQEAEIKFWPGCIREAGVQFHSIRLLGVGRDHLIKSEQIVSWLAYELPAAVMQRLNDAEAPLDLDAATRTFLPLVGNEDPVAELRGLPAGDSNRRTFDDALVPLAVALESANLLSMQFSGTDMYYKPVGAVSDNPEHQEAYQGLWYGPERIWQGDLVRLKLRRKEVERRVANLRESEPDARDKGLFVQIKHIYPAHDHDTGLDDILLKGELYEMAALGDDEDMEDVERREQSAGTRYIMTSQHSRGRGPYPLPKAPQDHRFRRIAPDLVFKIDEMAGRYDPSPVFSPPHNRLLSGDPSGDGLKAYGDVATADADRRALMQRVASLCGIAPGALAGQAYAQGSSAAPAPSGAPASSPAPAPTPAPAPAPDAGFVPLASQHFSYSALPYQADPNNGERGTQYGYNICNSTTEGPTSKCQTLIINSIDDFCLWGPPDPNSLVGNTEGEAVAWCTKPGHGTRVIPSGALTGVQFMKTPAYLQVTGHIQQQYINMDPTDGGGEMDPHGADQRGNPLGGLVFTNGFPASAGNANNYIQVVEWHNFMGSNVFCIKACDPSNADAANFCQHIFDRIGCQYNAPAAYVDGVFESCLGENQDFPGVYTGADGKVSTYTQPAESLGAISTIPYTARIPASSSCTPYQSAQIYTGQPTISTAAPTSSAPPANSVKASSAANAAVSASKSSGTPAPSTNSAAGVVAKSNMAGAWGVLVGVVGAVLGAVVAL